MRNSLTLLVFGLVLSFISCQKEETSTPSSRPNKGTAAGAKEPVEPDQPDPYTNTVESVTVELTSPSSPILNGASPFVPAGRASASYTSTGKIDKITTDIVSFGPAEDAAQFPFVPPTGSTKLWMGFIIRGNGSTYYNVRGYPVAISNGNAYWTAGSVNTQLIAGNITGTPMKYTWVPAVWDNQTGLLKYSAHWTCTNCGSVGETTANVTVSLIKIDSNGLLTLKATATFGGKTYTIDRVNFPRLAYN